MIEKTFIVVCVEIAIEGIFLYIRPSEIPREPSTVLAPPPRSEDAQIAREMVGAVMQEVKKAFPEAPMTLVPPPSPFVFRLYLTQKEYEDLHKPTVNDEIHIQLNKKEGE